MRRKWNGVIVGGRVVDKICANCGLPFKARVDGSRVQRFCSMKCFGKWERGSNNPAYNRVKTICGQCGKEFLALPHHLNMYKHHFCSRVCATQWFAHMPKWRNLKKLGPISDFQKELIYGCVLGDGFLSKPERGNSNLEIGHSGAQREYLEFKHEKLKPFVRPIRQREKFDRRTGKTYGQVRFLTVAHPFFTQLRENFYNGNGRKMIPDNICDYLTPVSLAFWIGDDGYFDGCSVQIATQGFDSDDRAKLLESLHQKFGVGGSLTKVGDIYIHKKSLPAIQELVVRNLPRSMRYKVSL